MKHLPTNLASRLALVLLAVLLVTYCVFFMMWRLQANRLLVPQMTQNIGTTIEQCRDPLNQLDEPARTEWITHFNARGSVSLVRAEAESTTAVTLPFVQHLEAQLREHWGDDIRVQTSRGREAELKVSFVAKGGRYQLLVPFYNVSGPARPFVWLFVSLGLVLWIVVTFVAGQVNKPLQRVAETLARSSDQLAEIDMPRGAPAEFRIFAERFNELAGRLAEQERERRLLLAGVSHDLRAPLTRIRLRAEMLDDEPAGKALVRDAESMRHIVDQFLDYHREIATASSATIDVGELATEIVARQQQLGRQVTLNGDAGPRLALDPLLFDRILSNLIDNALSHGAEPVDVRLSRPAIEVLELEVRDHGPGIGDSDMPRILKPFERVDGARSAQGHCGLGLAIVSRLAQQCGGTLLLANAEGGGLRATVRLRQPRAAGA